MDKIEKEAFIFGTIFTLANKLQIVGDRMDTQLTVKQWLFLAGVFRCGSKAPALSEVAACIGSSRQNIKKIASTLEKKGFLLIEKDVNDARIQRISLTEKCFIHLKNCEEKERQFIEKVFKDIREKELMISIDFFQKMEKNIHKMWLEND